MTGSSVFKFLNFFARPKRGIDNKNPGTIADTVVDSWTGDVTLGGGTELLAD